MQKNKTNSPQDPDTFTPENKIAPAEQHSNLGHIAFTLLFFMIVLGFANLGLAIADTVGYSLNQIAERIAGGLPSHYN